MDFKIAEYKLPDTITFNFEELKTGLTERTAAYKTMVYSENDIKGAKADRAELNRLKKEINDKRIACERVYMVPFESFKKQCNEIIGIIDEAVKNVDEQVKAFENKAKEEKETKIRELFTEINTIDWLSCDQIMDKKWLNASTSMGSVRDEMEIAIGAIKTDFESLQGLEYSLEATVVFKATLSLAAAIAENKRMVDLAKVRAEMEPKVETPAEPVEEPKDESPKDWVNFSAHVSETDFDYLVEWMDAHNIEWRVL